jgi:hypothetical protein
MLKPYFPLVMWDLFHRKKPKKFSENASIINMLDICPKKH